MLENSAIVLLIPFIYAQKYHNNTKPLELNIWESNLHSEL